MSEKAKAIKTLYSLKKITLNGVKQAAKLGIISEAEYTLIISE